jgi:hypothetical protein
MPIVRLTQGGTFSPEEIQLMTTAFGSACRIAGLTDPDRYPQRHNRRGYH